MEKKYILSELHATMKLKRMAYEILENNPGESELILAGIKDNGLAVAKQIQEILRQISPVTTQLLSLSFDKKKPAEITLSDKIDFNDKVIILVDDVANSGKALLYALKPFLQFYPRKIQTAVLVERSHKTYPVHPDYVGISLSTTLQEHIYVEVEGEKIKGAYLL
jgi:pyrimidine operon attenuation protein/uracil phosphoribosyltransferase